MSTIPKPTATSVMESTATLLEPRSSDIIFGSTKPRVITRDPRADEDEATWKRRSPFQLSPFWNETFRKSILKKNILKHAQGHRVPNTGVVACTGYSVKIHHAPTFCNLKSSPTNIIPADLYADFKRRVNEEIRLSRRFATIEPILFLPTYEAVFGRRHAYLILPAEIKTQSSISFVDERDLWCTFKKLVQAVAVMHSQGYAHRDLLSDQAVIWSKGGSFKLGALGSAMFVETGGVSFPVKGFSAGAIQRAHAARLQQSSNKRSKTAVHDTTSLFTPAGILKSDNQYLPPEIDDFYDAKAADVYLLGLWLLKSVYGPAIPSSYVFRDRLVDLSRSKQKDAVSDVEEHSGGENGRSMFDQRGFDPLGWCTEADMKALLVRMLSRDPENRPTVHEILNNEFVKRVVTCDQDGSEDKYQQHWHGIRQHEDPMHLHTLAKHRSAILEAMSSGFTLTNGESPAHHKPSSVPTSRPRSGLSHIPGIVTNFALQSQSTSQGSLRSLDIATTHDGVPFLYGRLSESFRGFVRCTRDGWETFVDIPAVSARFEIDVRDADMIEFAVCDEYGRWDNNGGQNYRVAFETEEQN
ncbi:hypothetical protein BJ742DRAFT_874785 [Cladochytrium replicatum]|nr:hypothetical protein BJ742DRAFT_874785 [Cladochytrium replicatum]